MKDRYKLIRTESEVSSLQKPPEPAIPSPHYESYGAERDEDERAHLVDYWRAVRKHLWLIVGICFLTTTLAGLYLARKPNVYTSRAEVQIDLENNNPALGAAKNSSVIMVNDPAYFNTQLQILTRPRLLRRVVKGLDLERDPNFARPQAAQTRSVWASLKRIVGLGGARSNEVKQGGEEDAVRADLGATAGAPREDLAENKRLAPYVQMIQENLDVDPVKETRLPNRETRLIEISYTGTNPQMAAKIVNGVADSFVLQNLERRTETNSNAGDFLQKRTAELQSLIRSGEERLITYAKNNQILTLDANQNTVVERLAGLNRQLLEAENERKLAEATYRAAQRPGAATALAEEAVKQIADSETDLAKLRQRREQLLAEDTEESPEVKEVDRQIAVIGKHIGDTRNRAATTLTTNLDTRYRQTLAREQSLRDAFNRQRGETLTQNEAAVNYRIIQQEIETNKSLLDGLLQRSRENDVVLAGMPNNITVTDYANTPDEPVGPNRLLGISMALILSLALGIGLALLLEYLDNTVRSVEDVERRLHLPALGVIPAVKELGRRGLLGGMRGGALQSIGGEANDQPELLINADPRSQLAEAYRHLRTSVLLSTAGRAPKTLLVTSSQPAEGKTTTAINVAVSLAQTGAKVLIIDADMRRPRLHSLFGLNNNLGLSSILATDMSDAEIANVAEWHESSQLHVITSGPIPPNPAELIGSEQMRRLINALSASYTHIVVDSPPIGSVTDGVLIASMVDGVLLVVHGGRSSRDIVRRSRRLLLEVGAKVFGAVLNNVELRPHDYYYNQYYREGYYGVSSDTETLASRTEA
ncbi:MAG: polysaccharide biosynthesis tyrosine autokinase [Acidobacteria bacterium]|nr:polysaccharide biosynthesis tyrosine autokinase [Acidobacteriota bacterium]